jgi:glyoxylase-like metal-dependent hydrolase (beta-lactamase superfamily II)
VDQTTGSGKAVLTGETTQLPLWAAADRVGQVLVDTARDPGPVRIALKLIKYPPKVVTGDVRYIVLTTTEADHHARDLNRWERAMRQFCKAAIARCKAQGADPERRAVEERKAYFKLARAWAELQE